MEVNEANVMIDGDEVRTRRKLAGYSLVQFAELADISFTYLSMIERGDRQSVSPPVFVRICDALGITKKNRPELIRSARAS